MIDDILTKDPLEPTNEVFNAYNELLRKLQDTPKVITPEVQEEERIEKEVVAEKKHIVETAVKETSTGIADHVFNLKTSVTQFLDDIEVKLLAEQKKVETLHEAITIQSQQLEDLYDIRVQADTLAALLLANKEKVVTLEQEISLKRQLWQKEQDDHDAKVKDRNALIARDRQREEENYNMKRDILRQKDQDEHSLAARQLEHELTTKRFQLEEEFRIREAKIISKEQEMQNQFETTKRHLELDYASKRAQTEEEFKEREARIVQREQEFLLLKERVEKFSEEIQRVASETEQNVTNTLTLTFEYEAKLAAQEFETERKLHRQEVELLKEKLERLETLNYSFNPIAYNPAI